MFLDAVGGHPRCNIIYDPSHFVLQQLDYLAFIDIYHERIKAFHVKDAEFNPTGRQGVYCGYQGWVEPRRPLPLARRRPGRFRRHLLQARAVRLRRLGGARVGVLPEASRGRRARRRALHRAATSSASPRRRSTISPAAAPTERPTRDDGHRATGAAGLRRSDRWSASEGTMRNAGARPIRLGMVGGGQGAFIGAVHRIAARIDDDYELVAGALSSNPGAGQGLGRRARPRPRAQLRLLRGDGQGRGEAPRRHRGGRHRHAEPHALPGGQGLPRGRHPRHLRQAADDDAGRGEEARRAGRKDRQGLRADPQLHRLSDGPAGARDGRRRACSARSASCRSNIRRTG